MSASEACAQFAPQAHAPRSVTPHETDRPQQPDAPSEAAPDTGDVPETAPARATRRVRTAPGSVASGGRIGAISVSGNDRIETSTILSYMVSRPGDSFSQDELDRSLRTLYATGLFKDVTLSRSGDILRVHVTENPVVNRIVFEGNHAAKDEDLRKVISLRPRAVFSAEQTATDRQKLLEVYAQKARYGATVTPETVKLAHNRVDVVFRIVEGPQTLIRKITFVGNQTFSEARLAGVVSSKETAWYRFFSSADEYNPERLRYDSELLRRFYLSNGFVDFQIVNATGELSPDRKSFYVTYTIKEGPRYRLGKIDIRSSLRHVPALALRKYIEVYPNQWYDGTEIQKNANRMEENIQAEGTPFAVVRPSIARNPEKRVVNLLFDVSEGPRNYAERIDINGNTITRDTVIRRQLPMAEGDPYPMSYKKYTRQTLQDLGYFSSVDVTQSQGSAPDRSNVAINVVEKPTGEFSLGGGYSTDVGILGNVGLKQHNLLGSGIDAGISGTVGYYQKQIDASVTDPFFLNRNLVVGMDIFYINNNYQTYQNYSEGRYGATFRMGYAITEHLSQSWTYSAIGRHVGNTWDDVSIYVDQQNGHSFLSQLGTTLVYDTRDNRLYPHKGYVIRLGGDFAGLGGNEKYVRGKIDAAYTVPLDDLTGNHDWTLDFKGGAGYMADWGNGRHDIIDNFYLGGSNLRGFLDGGVGPRSVAQSLYAPDGGYSPGYNRRNQEDLLGGRFIYTASMTLNFPMPFAADMGIRGRYFVDAGSLSSLRVRNRYTNAATAGDYYTRVSGNTATPRVSTGVGFSWKSPFGLLNIDLGVPLHKSHNDRTQLLRFGFGQQF
ncbi:outer membrane protein assembly factor BamA [Acetobacter sp. AN02]|uniref:outer membrane protein assembly factor BamA n=1 Tax=Acetobacter sp. AN02 TaxID=2894186 RepID=UPI0038D17701